MQIGPYLVLEEIARGGQGLVYRAQGPSGEQVALKLLLAHRQLSDKARKRFLIEVGTLSRLQHPHVVPVAQVGEHEGAPWLAMEFVAGESLEARLRRGPMDLDDAIQVARQLAQALAHVHASGVLHRDLKPANVLLGQGPEGLHAKLTDFGLARDEQAAHSRLTVAGAMSGTPGYWAPEQARGEIDAFGPWTDLYGLGAVLYTCLTGEPPVEANDLEAVFAVAHGRAAPSPRHLRPDVPDWLDALCRSCLAFRPEDRPLSAVAVVEALDQGRARSGRPGRRGVGLIAGVGLVAGAGALTLLLKAGGLPWGADPVVIPPAPPPSAEADAATREARELYAKGRAARMGSRFLEALELLERGIELDPDLPGLYTERGGAKAGLGRIEEALADLEHAIELDPRDDLAYALRGVIRSSAGDHQAALADLERALELEPTRVMARTHLGACQFELGWFEDAIASLDQALILEPTRTDALVLRGRAHTQLKRYDQAIADYDRAIEIDPECVNAFRHRADAHHQLEHLTQAYADYGRAIELAPDAQLHYWRGRVAAQQGRHEAAIRDFGRAIELDPSVPLAHAHRGTQLLLERRFGEALADLDHALELQPTYPFALLNRGWCLAELERHEEAIADFSASIALEPGYPLPYARRAWSQAELGRFDAALADCERALQCNERTSLAWTCRARCRLEQGRHAEALRDLEQALQLEDQYPHAYVYRAAVYLAQGAPRRALEDLERIATLPNPPNSAAHFAPRPNGSAPRPRPSWRTAASAWPDFAWGGARAPPRRSGMPSPGAWTPGRGGPCVDSLKPCRSATTPCSTSWPAAGTGPSTAGATPRVATSRSRSCSPAAPRTSARASASWSRSRPSRAWSTPTWSRSSAPASTRARPGSRWPSSRASPWGSVCAAVRCRSPTRSASRSRSPSR